jgi:hypothetical protein
MGDRFVLLRLDATEHRHASGLQTVCSTGQKAPSSAELAAGVVAGRRPGQSGDASDSDASDSG